MPPDFSLDLDVSSRCVRCGAEREPEGTKLLTDDRNSGSTYMVRAKRPCECGEDRIKVRFEFGD